MKIRIAGLVQDSIVDGPGLRLTVFFQGCKHNCKGCHNPETHAMDGGYDIDIDEIVEMARSNPLLSGVTLSGGEPLLQLEGAIELARKINELGLNVICYSGYTWEYLISEDRYRELLGLLKYLIDGKFILEKRSLMLNFRGSENQRIINVKKSLEENAVIEEEL